MRIFDTYYFNIIDKAAFKDTKPYLDTMLSELGYSYQNIGFMLYDITSTNQQKAIAKMPALEKYSFSSDGFGLTSFRENWREGNVHIDKADYADVSTLFSKIPRPYSFSFGKLILDGINWFPDSDLSVAIKKHDYRQEGCPTQHQPPFISNRIMQLRYYDDGKKYNHIFVTIDVTADPEPRNSREIIERLIPYLGEPSGAGRECVFDKDTFERNKALCAVHYKRLKEYMTAELPVAKRLLSDNGISHVADKPTITKAFKGTGFKRDKGTPSWLNIFSFLDERNYLYKAHFQKLSVCDGFRFWLTISGYNFSISYEHDDYYVEKEGESLGIITDIAKLCVKLQSEFSEGLVQDFGITPSWQCTKLSDVGLPE